MNYVQIGGLDYIKVKVSYYRGKINNDSLWETMFGKFFRGTNMLITIGNYNLIKEGNMVSKDRSSMGYGRVKGCEFIYYMRYRIKNLNLVLLRHILISIQNKISMDEV